MATFIKAEGPREAPADLLSWWDNLGERGQRLAEELLEKNGTFFENSEEKLVEIFNGCSKALPKDSITLGDFKKGNGAALAALKKGLGYVSEGHPSQADRRYGSLTHQVLPLILEGKLPRISLESKPSLIRGVQLSFLDVKQAPEQEESIAQEELLLWGFNPVREWPSLDGFRRIVELPRVVLQDLALCVDKYQAELKASQKEERVGASDRARKYLLPMLQPIMGGFLQKLPRYGEPYADHLFTLTLLEWAKAIIFSAENRSERIIFKEIDMFSRDKGVSAGRIDALEVKSIDGRVPNGKENLYLAQLSARRFSSVGDLSYELRKVFGPAVVLKLTDWKCAVGDFHGRFHDNGDMVSPSDCPKPEHVEQVKRYQALEPLALYRPRGEDPHFMNFSRPSIGESVLTYVLPTHPMFDHPVSIDGGERHSIFQRQFVSKWSGAGIKSKHRQLTQEVMRLSMHGVPPRRAQKKQDDLRLLKHKTSTLHDVIEKHREYVDAFKIVEKVETRRAPIYKLNYGELCRRVASGEVFVSSFHPEEGGRVRCLSGKHEDVHPAMKVSLDRGAFHCFACGFCGKIAPESVNSELLHLLKFEKMIPLDKVVIPWECHEILGAAHRFMNRIFQGSPAEKYLVQVRKLDPELAYLEGAGNGSVEVVLHLLDLGHSLDDLAMLGVITYSPRASKESELVKEIREEFGWRLKDIERNGNFPYTLLRDRVTFPLKLKDYYTNIYGRAIGKAAKDNRHRKLQVKWQGKKVAQGGFNLEALRHDEVLVTEAPIDALTLRAMGHNAVAIVGTDNPYVLHEIRASGKKVHLAFNADDPGAKAAGKTVHFFRKEEATEEKEFEHITDFTREFFRSIDTDAKDYNQWWQAKQSRLA